MSSGLDISEPGLRLEIPLSVATDTLDSGPGDGKGHNSLSSLPKTHYY